jgi:hypothetical protein
MVLSVNPRTRKLNFDGQEEERTLLCISTGQEIQAVQICFGAV